ncbi:hypothetical protein D3C73_1429220 [compost metagenome]
MISTEETSSVNVTGIRLSRVMDSEKRSSKRATSVSVTECAGGVPSVANSKLCSKISSCLLIGFLSLTR